MISLYPHNEKAYNKARSILEHQDRTCIVHATGTGKSLIACKFLIDNPTDKFLFVAPTIFIFNEIKKHLKDKKYNIDFKTYAYFIDNDLSAFINYDYIFLDEFHRIGAEEWGKSITQILNQNPNAKKLGLSATHIRYLDDERNMADEVFNGSIASYLDLGTAIEQGIHKVPKYVSALYNIKEIINKTEERLKTQNRIKELEKLQSRKVIWEESTGINFIIKKHLHFSRRKILIFCKTKENIQFVSKLIEPILKEIYHNKIEFNTVYSSLGDSKNTSIFSHFENSNATQVLYCIDMLNEGIHVKNVDTVMMFRDTISPIIYFQQMGRSFAVGQEQPPLIFDFVNNFNIKNSINSLQQSFYADFSNNKETNFFLKRKLIIEFYDETLDFKKFIDEFVFFNNWEERFEEFKIFFEVNKRFPTTKEFKWFAIQKQEYNKGNLTKEQIDKLLSVDKNVFKKIIEHKSWEERFKEFKTFFEVNKRLPSNREFTWFAVQKQEYNKGNLTKEQINKFLCVDKNIFQKKIKSWEQSFKEYKDFIKVHERLPSQREMLWTRAQKIEYKKGTLSKEQINKLLSVDKNFFKKQTILKSWEQQFKEFKMFVEKNKRFPTNKENYWYTDQKKFYKKGTLSKEQINKLLSIDKNVFEVLKKRKYI